VDVLEQLTQEHRAIEQLLGTLRRSAPGDIREAALTELERVLHDHTSAEERYIYPLLADLLGEAHTDIALIEHHLAQVALSAVIEATDEDLFGRALDMLTAGFIGHAIEEEHVMFPALRAAVADHPLDLHVEIFDRGHRP
jgi:hemerythrin superfamily protein